MDLWHIKKKLLVLLHAHFTGFLGWELGQLNKIGVYLRSLSEQDWYHFGEV
jgi:hypothetical protein